MNWWMFFVRKTALKVKANMHHAHCILRDKRWRHDISKENSSIKYIFNPYKLNNDCFWFLLKIYSFWIIVLNKNNVFLVLNEALPKTKNTHFFIFFLINKNV